MVDLRLECPTCHTSYEAARCGVSPKSGDTVSATIVCILCQSQFDATLTPTPGLGWWARVVLRRPAPVSHAVKTAAR